MPVYPAASYPAQRRDGDFERKGGRRRTGRLVWSEDRLNGIDFCHLLQVPIPGKQESLHVAREDQRFSHPPKDPQRCLEGERINHERSRWLWDEGMVML